MQTGYLKYMVIHLVIPYEYPIKKLMIIKGSLNQPVIWVHWLTKD